MIGLVRLASEGFGPTLGMALLYSIGTAVLWAVRRPRGLRSFPGKYLLIGGAFFVATEVCVSLAVGLAADAAQAIEVGAVNYLWPTGTVLLVALLHRRHAFWSVLPGALVATLGIALAIGGDAGLDLHSISSHVAENPLPYALALAAAIAWSCYNALSPLLSRGRDGMTVFFTAVSASLWILHAVAGAPVPDHVAPLGVAAVIGGGAAIAAGYAFWNIGILHGDMRLLSTASYATPVLSSAVAALMVGTVLSAPFWLGVALVAAGSLLSWYASRRSAPESPAPTAVAVEQAMMEPGRNRETTEERHHGARQERPQRPRAT